MWCDDRDVGIRELERARAERVRRAREAVDDDLDRSATRGHGCAACRCARTIAGNSRGEREIGSQSRRDHSKARSESATRTSNPCSSRASAASTTTNSNRRDHTCPLGSEPGAQSRRICETAARPRPRAATSLGGARVGRATCPPSVPAVPPDGPSPPPDFVGVGAQKAGTTWWYSLARRRTRGCTSRLVAARSCTTSTGFWDQPFAAADAAALPLVLPAPGGRPRRRVDAPLHGRLLDARRSCTRRRPTRRSS